MGQEQAFGVFRIVPPVVGEVPIQRVGAALAVVATRAALPILIAQRGGKEIRSLE